MLVCRTRSARVALVLALALCSVLSAVACIETGDAPLPLPVLIERELRHQSVQQEKEMRRMCREDRPVPCQVRSLLPERVALDSSDSLGHDIARRLGARIIVRTSTDRVACEEPEQEALEVSRISLGGDTIAVTLGFACEVRFDEEWRMSSWVFQVIAVPEGDGWRAVRTTYGVG